MHWLYFPVKIRMLYKHNCRASNVCMYVCWLWHLHCRSIHLTPLAQLLTMRRSNSKRNGDLTPQLFGAADQSQVSGCLVTSRRCLPSAADEGWHSPKRTNSTVAVNSSSVFTEASKYHPFITRSQWQQAPLHTLKTSWSTNLFSATSNSCKTLIHEICDSSNIYKSI